MTTLPIWPLTLWTGAGVWIPCGNDTGWLADWDTATPLPPDTLAVIELPEMEAEIWPGETKTGICYPITSTVPAMTVRSGLLHCICQPYEPAGVCVVSEEEIDIVTTPLVAFETTTGMS